MYWLWVIVSILVDIYWTFLVRARDPREKSAGSEASEKEKKEKKEKKKRSGSSSSDSDSSGRY